MSSAVTIEVKSSKWTDEQWEAITQSGQDILVAAAAGSGKTAVLVERMVKKVTDPNNPVDVDRLLVVTFTNAAAAEMRQRIGSALEKELSNNPSSNYLKKQLSLLNRASISTLHSFCIEIARKYYYELEIDPRFRVVDETESELIREEVIEELFEEEYSTDDETFLRVADWYSQDRHDLDLQLLVRKLYDFSRAYPWPNQWLDQLVESYKNVDRDNNEWIKVLKDDVKLQLKGTYSLLQKAFRIALLPGGPTPYAENLTSDLQYVERLLKIESWDDMFQAFQQKGFDTLKRVKKDEVDPELQEQVKDLREEAKKQIGKLKDETFSRPLEDFVGDIEKMEPIIRVLVELTKKYSQKFWVKKQEKALVDFSDLEHLALELLNKNGRPSNAALDLQGYYHEVLVDEYQDVNLVQETILRLVSKGHNRFMVGDVKQSIYRFRLAEPSLFLNKYKAFNSGGNGLRIDLAKNFRSRRQVLDGTNFIFKQLMDEAVGDIEYDDAAELKLGASYVDTEIPVEVLMINRNGQGDDDEVDVVTLTPNGSTTAELEGKVLARKIKSMIQEKYQVTDKETGEQRNATYRDIVILLRSFTPASTIMEELKKQGIPGYAELSTGYFEAVEVQVMLSLLKVIDNPYQDIPLVASLRSPLISLTEEDLAQIRIQHKKGPFFDAIVTFAKRKRNGLARRLVTFLKQLGEWRDAARDGSLSELIWTIYRETNYYDFVGGMNGGKQRQANLQALYDRARQYESTSFRGLFRFLRFIERMQERGDDLGTARALGEQEDVVRLMTIHKSKGLEFPIVFVAGMNKQFNMQDMRERVLLHKELGYGSRFVNLEARVSYITLPHLAIRKRMQRELIAEEMRVLYVAMTRAKEKLILLGTLKDAEKSFETWQRQLTYGGWVLPDFERVRSKSYFDWIGPALIRHKDAKALNQEKMIEVPLEISQFPSHWYIEVVDGVTLTDDEVEATTPLEETTELLKSSEIIGKGGIFKERVESQLIWSYPNQDAQFKGAKQSVTEMKRQREVVDASSNMQLIKHFKAPIAERPRFMQQRSLTSAEIGTAMHTVMQQIRFQPIITEEYVRKEIERMMVQELISVEQEEVIQVKGVVKFFESALGQQLLSSKKYYREVPFSYGISSREAYSDWVDQDEQIVLVQGVFDCVFETDDGLVIIDYKTDSVLPKDSHDGFERIKGKYKIQMNLYGRAVSEIWNKKVIGTNLYLFDGGHIVQM